VPGDTVTDKKRSRNDGLFDLSHDSVEIQKTKIRLRFCERLAVSLVVPFRLTLVIYLVGLPTQTLWLCI
jgi:hypothetical protein